MAVMALGEDRDAVDVGALHRPRKFRGIEFNADIRDERRGMKIEMHLALVLEKKVVEGRHWRRKSEVNKFCGVSEAMRDDRLRAKFPLYD